MITTNLKSLLASMSAGEIQQLLAEIKRYASSSATIDSLKRVLDSGYLLEFLLEDGDCILVDKFITSEPAGENEAYVFFKPFGSKDDITLRVQLDTSDGWILNSANPFYNFKYSAPTNLMFENELFLEKIDAISVSVCKFQRGVYDEPCEMAIERETADLLKNIIGACKSDKEDCEASCQCDDCGYTCDECDECDECDNTDNAVVQKLEAAFSKIEKWLSQDNRRAILDISRSYTFEDEYSSSKRRNNFNLVFGGMTYNFAEKIATFKRCVSCDAYYHISAEEFINGSVGWDDKSKSLVITNEDKTYTIRVTFMEDANTMSLEDGPMKDVKELILNA